MEISDLQVRDPSSNYISVYIKQENDEHEAEFNDVEIISTAQHFCTIEIKETRGYINESKEFSQHNDSFMRNTTDLNALHDLNESSHSETCTVGNVLADSIYLSTLDAEPLNVDIRREANSAAEVFPGHNDIAQATNYNFSTVTIPSQFLEGIHLNIKKEINPDQSGVYTAEWLCSINDDNSLKLKVTKDGKQKAQIPADVETSITPLAKRKNQQPNEECNINKEDTRTSRKFKKRAKLKSAVRQDYREKLRRKAECMREKRKKLYDQESEEQRLQRLAREAAKRREMRMYYETPEQRRKRLDAEAARKREYRMYNETPEDKRKRLDREAERRRIKRLSLYASETPEQRRERLNRESAKRREARLNQYAKETEEQRKERLRRDALRAREMRFTRSAIETEEERRQRLVKDALRKREVRMHGGQSVSNNFTELQTVRNFEELNNVQMKDNPDNHLGGHYLSNWMMWFQNTLAQPVHVGEQTSESQSQNNS